MRYIFFILLVVILSDCNDVYGQTQDSLDIPGSERYMIAMTSRSDGERIKLRWAPSASRAWRYGNEVGYRVVRYTIMRDNKLLPEEERMKGKSIHLGNLKPWTEEDKWVDLAMRDSIAAIAAQALIGESFVLSKGGSGLESFRDLLSEQENRFSFGLFAADHSFETACAMGLGFLDTDVIFNETYLYRVFAGEKASSELLGTLDSPKSFPIQIDSGFTAIKTSDVYQLPKIQEVEADFQDGQALVSWNSEIFNSFYVSYVVERSTDGVQWDRLNTLPLVPMYNQDTPEERMFWMDTFPTNNQVYFYRVKGRNVFDEYSEPSDPVYGMGLPSITQHYPQIVSVFENELGQMLINWTFNEEAEKLIRGFKIRRSEQDAAVGEILNGTIFLDPSERNFLDSFPIASNYYRVIAVDSLYREISSFSALAMLNDDEPPQPPQNIRGRIAKDGRMLITWDPNKEGDLLGYRVFRSFHPEEEFTLMTSAPVLRNFHSDSVNLNTLNSEMYIRVTALDYRYNTSSFSEIAVLYLPDTIPPAPPAIKDLRADTEGVFLSWANSQSADISLHELQRRSLEQDEWEILQSIEGLPEEPISSFLDREIQKGKKFVYRIMALDQSGNVSYSDSLISARIDDFIRPPVEDLTLQPDRRRKLVELRWTYPEAKAVKVFEIHRWTEGGLAELLSAYAPEALATTTGNRPKKREGKNEGDFYWEDTTVRMNTQYYYSIKVIHKDGGRTYLSQAELVAY